MAILTKKTEKMKATYNPSKEQRIGFYCHAVSILLMTILILPCFISCRKMSHNGKLDGFWQIQNIEITNPDITPPPFSINYISINLHVVNLGAGGNKYSGNLHYDKEEQTVTMDFPYTDLTKDPDYFNKWGIYSNPVVCKILKVDSKNLILQTPETIITCRRF